MIILPLVVLAAWVGATESVSISTDSDSEEPTAEQLAQFALLKGESMGELGLTEIITPPPKVNGVVKPPPTYEEINAARRAAFDKQFEEGAYERLMAFKKRCNPDEGCNKLATANFISTAQKFVDLKKDVKDRVVVEESEAYQTRHQEIKTGLRTTLDEFRPKQGQTPTYTTELIKVTDPIVKKIFSKEEFLKYAAFNAANSNSAPAYTYLGQGLNGNGPPVRAKNAFDLALQRDPSSQEALSGRAQAKFNLGDFPGAAADARAALRLDPGDQRAHATLKLSEGRGMAGSSTGPGAAQMAPGAQEPPSSGLAGAASPLAAAGAGPGPEAISRSRDLALQAKRSLSMGEPQAALESANQAIALNAQNVQALLLAAMAHSRLKDYPASLAAAEAGLKLAPDSVALLDAKAFALNHMKDYRGALQAANRALEINPRDGMAHFNRAAALGGMRDREGMLASLRAAAQVDPKFLPILDAALTMPDDGDIMLLLPGENPAARPSASQDAKAPAARTAFPLWAAGLLAGVFLALLFLAQRKPQPVARPPSLRASRPAAPPAPAVPTLLAEKYEVGRQLGVGGMGVVYVGQDRSLDRPVAIKRMREEIRFDEKERKRFVAEAKLVAKLRHPSIVEIHAIVEQDTEVFLIFEYVSGQTLHELIRKEGRLPFDRARDLFRGVASALEYAHGHGVIHRDLKPANIMLDGEGRVRVMDFGIARLAEEALSRHSARSVTNSVVGTPPYMAPEQEQSVARKESDVYSMAICFYEVLTGRVPFGGGSGAGLLLNKLKKTYEPASTLAQRMPEGLNEVFAQAFEPDPDNRYPSAEKFMRALESLETPARQV